MFDHPQTLVLTLLLTTLLAVPLSAEDPKPGDLKLVPRTITIQGEQIAVELGRLQVPERHDDPDGNLVELAFVRFPSRAETPGPPIVYLAGGPGGSGIVTARSVRFSVFRALTEVADVIALDQRGTGMTRPSLAFRRRWDLPLDRPAQRQEMARIAIDRARGCATYFQDKGIDLAAYNTVESAADVDALRRALGAEKISLWGTSYGTHLAMAIIRRHGKHVHRAVLSGVEGPDHTLKLPSQIQEGLEKVAELSNADLAVSHAVPDLLALVEEVLNRLDREPVTVEAYDPIDRRMVQITLGKLDLQVWTAGAVGRRGTLVQIPAVYDAMAHGDFQPLADAMIRRRRSTLGSAMSLMMDCASGASAKRLERIKREAEECLLGDVVNFPHPDVCEAFGNPDLGAEFRSPLRSDVPMLLVSGTLDSRTPISNAEEIRAGLPNSQHLVIENAGHDEMLFSQAPGLREAIVAFMRDGSVSRKRIAVEPPQFTPIVR